MRINDSTPYSVEDDRLRQERIIEDGIHPLLLSHCEIWVDS